MKCVCIPLSLGLLTLSAAAWAGPVDEPRSPAAPVTASGVYAVTFHLNVGDPVPAGATLTCKAKILPTLPGAAKTAPEPVRGIGTATGCALELPFSWAVNHPQSGTTISYEVDEVSGAGSVVRSTSERQLGVVLPPPGGYAHLDLGVTF